MPVGRDGEQLVSGAAPEFQDTPASPIGLDPVEVDRRLATREHQVVQSCVRIELVTHEAHPLLPARLQRPCPPHPTQLSYCRDAAGTIQRRSLFAMSVSTASGTCTGGCDNAVTVLGQHTR